MYFEVHLHNRSAVSLPRHFIVVVIDGGQKGAAGGFEVFHIVAVPDDVHRVHIEKRDFDFKAVAAVDVFFHEFPCVTGASDIDYIVDLSSNGKASCCADVMWHAA